MKRFWKNKTARRLIGYALLFLLSEGLRVLLPSRTGNENWGRLFAFCEIALALLTVREILAWMYPKTERVRASLRQRIAGFAGLLFRPITSRITRILERRARLISGTDERTFVAPWDLAESLKKRLDLRKKINLKHCENNEEKLRMLYIRRVLTLRAEGMDVRDCATPCEIGEQIRRKTRRTEMLFDVYSRCRYRQHFPALPDELLKQCESAGAENKTEKSE